MEVLILGSQVLTDLITSVRKGYEAKGKREVGGHILGYRAKNGYRVKKVVPYNTSNAKRTFWGPDAAAFARKGRKIGSGRLKWIGVYHSHVEIRGSASTGQSDEDMEAHVYSGCPVELIVRVSNYGMNWPESCLSLVVPQNGYRYYYDICGHIADSRGRIRKMRVMAGR
jgi:proteasome lid subunit RPN8/RPN11